MGKALKKDYITVLSVISSFCVVLLHVNSCYWSCFKTEHWQSANIIECLCYFAVPVFFMISGTTLIDYREKYNTKTFFKKRFMKTFIPFIIWSVIGFLYCIKTGRITVEGNFFVAMIDSIINYKALHTFWFFPPLFSAYFLIPVISLIPKEKRQSIFKYIIFTGILLNSLLPFAFNLLAQFAPNISPKLSFNGNYNLSVASGCLIYLFIGYYISNYEIKKSSKAVIYALGISALFVHIFGTAYISTENVSRLFKGYNNIPPILYSSAVFLFFKNLNFNKAKFVVKISEFFSGETFGVYLIHMFIIWFITAKFNTPFHSLWYRVFGAVGIFLAAALIVKLVRKIPFLKFIFP